MDEVDLVDEKMIMSKEEGIDDVSGVIDRGENATKSPRSRCSWQRSEEVKNKRVVWMMGLFINHCTEAVLKSWN